jgi:hypothetical protein
MNREVAKAAKGREEDFSRKKARESRKKTEHRYNESFFCEIFAPPCG